MSQYDINDPRNPNSPFNMSNPDSPWSYKNPYSPNYDRSLAESRYLRDNFIMSVVLLVMAIAAVWEYPVLLVISLILFLACIKSITWNGKTYFRKEGPDLWTNKKQKSKGK
jgi:hypothetical protein